MSQVDWSEVAEQFSDLQGEVCSIQVEDVGMDDWQALLDEIRSVHPGTVSGNDPSPNRIRRAAA